MRQKRDKARSQAQKNAKGLEKMLAEKNDMARRAETLANRRFELVYYVYCSLYEARNVKKANCGRIDWDSYVDLDELKPITREDISNFRTGIQNIFRALDLSNAKLVGLHAERIQTHEKHKRDKKELLKKLVDIQRTCLALRRDKAQLAQLCRIMGEKFSIFQKQESARAQQSNQMVRIVTGLEAIIKRYEEM